MRLNGLRPFTPVGKTNMIAWLAARCDESGQPPQAVPIWHRLTTLDPLSARYAMGDMRALAAAGALLEARSFSTAGTRATAQPC